jgi:hypothetical protein
MLLSLEIIAEHIADVDGVDALDAGGGQCLAGNEGAHLTQCECAGLLNWKLSGGNEIDVAHD